MRYQFILFPHFQSRIPPIMPDSLITSWRGGRRRRRRGNLRLGRKGRPLVASPECSERASTNRPSSGSGTRQPRMTRAGGCRRVREVGTGITLGSGQGRPRLQGTVVYTWTRQDRSPALRQCRRAFPGSIGAGHPRSRPLPHVSFPRTPPGRSIRDRLWRPQEAGNPQRATRPHVPVEPGKALLQTGERRSPWERTSLERGEAEVLGLPPGRCPDGPGYVPQPSIRLASDIASLITHKLAPRLWAAPGAQIRYTLHPLQLTHLLI